MVAHIYYPALDEASRSWDYQFEVGLKLPWVTHQVPEQPDLNETMLPKTNKNQPSTSIKILLELDMVV